jgi:hypothetical protein
VGAGVVRDKGGVGVLAIAIALPDCVPHFPDFGMSQTLIIYLAVIVAHPAKAVISIDENLLTPKSDY